MEEKMPMDESPEFGLPWNEFWVWLGRFNRELEQTGRLVLTQTTIHRNELEPMLAFLVGEQVLELVETDDPNSFTYHYTSRMQALINSLRGT